MALIASPVIHGNKPATARLMAPAELLASESYAAMDILNGVAEQFPDAVSLAAGRPPGTFLPAARTPALLESAISQAAGHAGGDGAASLARAWIRYGQYADTDGIIQDDLMRLFTRLEGVDGSDLDLRVTNGIQEALLIECALAAARGGAVLSFDPVYAGLTGAAAAAGLPLVAIPRQGEPAADIAEAIALARRTIAGPLLLYLIPDHDNPTGLSLGREDRLQIVELARRANVTVLEDTAYRLFNYDEARQPSLFALDQAGDTVVYLASFAKTFMPGVRIGFSVRRRTGRFTAEHLRALTNLKSYVSVTSAPIAQAIVSGFLRDCDFDLDRANQAKRDYCRANRDVLIAALRENLDSDTVSIARPAGGFFLTLNTARSWDQDAMVRAARDFGVIFIPMMLFSPTGQGEQQIRLSFSAGTESEMIEGARRLAAVLRAAD